MKRAIFIFIILLFSLGAAAAGQSSSYTSTPTILADEKEMTDEFLVAKGNVELAWAEYRIYADYMRFNQKTRVVEARGRVTMSSKDTVISGEKLEFNLKDRSGVLFDTYGQMPPSIRYKTDKLTQVDNDTMKFENIDFTSCIQCVPRWKITCKKGKIKKDKYVELKNAVLKIKNIPIFYIPYMRYPVRRDGKASGILFPALGTSDRRGFFILNKLFWNMKANVDLTLGFDYYGKAGIGLSEEFRYLFPSMEGNIKFYWFKYKSDVILEPEEPQPEDRFWSYNTSDYLLKASHRQKLDFLNTDIIVDVDRQSDANFLRLFSNDFDAALRRSSKSSISIVSSIANVKLSLNAAQHDTYFTFNNTSRTLRYLPKITLNWNHQKIWKVPGYFSLRAQYSGVQRIGKSLDIDENIFVTDVRTQRLSISPSYSLSMVKTAWLGAKLTFNSKQSFYFKSRDPLTKEVVDETLHLGFHTAKLELKGPIFSKIFEFANSKLKHVIEPLITMRYVTKVDDEDRARLIPVDNFDYPTYSYVGFKLTNRLLWKKNNTNSAKEVFSYSVSQDYYFDPSLASRGRKINDEIPVFSELKNTIRIRPIKYFTLDASLALNHYIAAETFIDRFTRLRVNLAYNNKKSPVWGNFNYSRYVNPFAAAGYIFNRDMVGGRLNIDFPKFPLKLDGVVNYDITEREFRHASIKVSYDYQCLRFLSELRLFKYGGRVETQFNFGVSFGNMGVVKDFLGIEDD
jgi:LPS-assembly protein